MCSSLASSNVGRIMTVSDLFQPLIGLAAWQVKRGVGTFFTMEFGPPRLEVREPKKQFTGPVSEPVRRILQGRKISVLGEWHFWLQYCDWQIRTASSFVASDEEDNAKLDTVLREVDGQILTLANDDSTNSTCNFTFDLGAKLTVTPSAEFEGEDLWTLYRRDSPTYAYNEIGKLVLLNEDAPPS